VLGEGGSIVATTQPHLTPGLGRTAVILASIYDRSFLCVSHSNITACLPIVALRIRSVPSAVSWVNAFLEEHLNVRIPCATHSTRCTLLQWCTKPPGPAQKVCSSTAASLASTRPMRLLLGRGVPFHPHLGRGPAACPRPRTRRVSTAYALIGACSTSTVPRSCL